MTFWTNSNFEPKMAYRWGITLDIPSVTGITDQAYKNLAEGIPSFYAKSVTKPAITYNTKEYSIINRKLKYPGNISWEPITITFIDTVDGKLIKFINNYFNGFSDIYTEKVWFGGVDIGTTNKSGFDYISTSNKTTLNELRITIMQYTADGEERPPTGSDGISKGFVEKWMLTNAFVRKFSSSPLDYSNDNLSEYTLEIDYDWAYLEQD